MNNAKRTNKQKLALKKSIVKAFLVTGKNFHSIFEYFLLPNKQPKQQQQHVSIIKVG